MANMKNNLGMYVMRALLFAAAQAAAIALIVPFAFWLSQNYEFFPRKLIPVWTSALPEDLGPTVRFMATASFAVFFVSQLIFGPTLPSTARRAAIEVYAFAIASTIGAVAMFFMSTAVFDPEVLLAIGILGILFFCIGHAIAFNWSRLTNVVGIIGSFLNVFKTGFGMLAQFKPFPFALAALIFTLSPVLLAYEFKSNRAFADRVTEIRMSFLPDTAGDATYTTVDAFPGFKLLQPMKLRFDPNDPNRAYVLLRGGEFYTFEADDPVNTYELLLDLTDEVREIHLETGAQGFDFHPDFEYGVSSGKNDFFIYFTSYTEEEQFNYLSSFDMSQPTPEARFATRFDLVKLGGKANASHNGGDVHFGPDGFLYFSVGDRLNFSNHQRIDMNLNGGLFRIDVDMQGGDVSFPPKRQPFDSTTAGYFIPADNPLVGVPDANEEFYAWGLRNPFRYNFDAEGRIWAGEVGAATWEEVNILEKGGNYQWPFAEGYVESDTPRPDPLYGEEKEPVFNYIHTSTDRAVIGGFVVEGARLEGLNGRYIFGDNFSGNLFAIDSTGEKVEASEVIGRVDQYGQRGLTSFTMSPEGEILVTTLGGRDAPQGDILKLVIDDGTIVDDGPDDADAEEIVATVALGKQHFGDNCSTCHGKDAVVTMIDLGYNMPDFADPAYHETRTDEELYQILELGGGRLGVDEAMPPWGEFFSKSDLDSIILYLRAWPEEGE
ncbi:MAG: PQQ-dependent sugar dehydrogenase [Pseudomonadota bacterium]